MKKEKHGDLEYVQLEEGDDVELFRKTFGLVLFRTNGVLYCANYEEGFALKLFVDKNEWFVIDFEELPEQEYVLEDEEAKEIYKKLPPFETIDKYKEDKAKKVLEYWDEKRKTTRRKVIGWIEPDSETLFGEADDYMIAAIINDIAEHNYYFGGDDLEIVPMFEDHICLDFSSSGWGKIEALANGLGGDYDYSLYKNASMLKPPFRRPKEGIYKK